MAPIPRRAIAVALSIATLAVAGCASTGTGTDAPYADRPVGEWPSQEVLRSFPDDRG